jgi:Lamin Tail Domain/Immunoglobulin I-set domain
MKRFILAGVMVFLGLVSLRAQLAVTEVMTGEADKNHPDWWELKNYGTNDIDLTGYSWNDDSHGGLSGADSAPFTGVTVHAGETICVTEIKGVVTDAASFRAWWGLDPGVQVVVLNAADPGLGDTGDAVRLWSTNLSALGSNTNGLDLEQAPEFLVQRINTIDISTPGADGRTITYNTNDGTYSIISTNGILGAFVAATTADVGSPGVAQDPTPVTITQVPVSRTNTVGDTATFTNGGFSLPPLHYHWFFAGNPIDSRTPGVKLTLTTNGLSILAVNNVQLTNAGSYTVIAENGLQSFTNTVALTVVGLPTAPVIQSVAPQLDSFDAFIGQTLTLSVTASGFPAPSYQWSTNNVPLADQTNSQLSLSLSDTNQTALYSVHVFNTAGSTNVSFNVRVTPVPNLVITEVMSGENSDTNGDTVGHGDWFELSNLGNFPVNLFGFRMDDNHQALAQSAPVTNRTMIQPFESVVFVQGMTPDAFRTWWGTNLPASVQIIGYNGSGQGLSGSGDDVHIWNAAATTDGDQVASVNFLTAPAGTSFGFDPTVSNQTGFLGFAPDGLSVVGVDGAFTAAVGGDIGSPGTIVNLPRTSISPTNGCFAISWVNQPNWGYTVQYKTNLTDPNWTTLTTVTSDSSAVFTIVDPTISTQRFYRVGLTP